MASRFIVAILGMFLGAGGVWAEEFDGVIKQPAKAGADGTSLKYEKVVLDNKGQVVRRFIQTAAITKETRIAMGKYNEAKKKWEAGAAVKDGVDAEMFKDSATTMLQVRMTTSEDRKTILQILIKEIGGELTKAGPDFDGVIQNVVQNGLWYIRTDLDEKGEVVKTYAKSSLHTTPETKVAMGKYNEKEKKWEAGEEIKDGLYGDIFKDLGNKQVHAHFIMRDDGKAVSEILVRKVGGAFKKK